MIKSMTGFGKSSLINEKREYQMEMKSVNHRYLDINIKLPRPLIFLEETIKKEIAAKIQRGKIEVFVTFNNKEQNSEKITINKELAKTYKRTSRRKPNINRNKCSRNSTNARCFKHFNGTR